MDDRAKRLMAATHVYIGVDMECGCVVAGAVDTGDKNTARWVSDFIKHGLTVERVPVEDARNAIRHCPHSKPRNARQGEMFPAASPR